MTRKEKIKILRERFERMYPDSNCTLKYESAFQLLIATQLAAQCTDARVNIVTETLFKKYPSIESFANASVSELENDIRSTGFYHNKAKNIIACSKRIIEEFSGEVPRTMEDLLRLEGTGRKTANLVLGDAFDIPGIVIDTHAMRLSKRIGLTKEETPEKIEKDLMKFIPMSYWTMYGHHMVDHGRAICNARNPKCESCRISDICAFHQNSK